MRTLTLLGAAAALAVAGLPTETASEPRTPIFTADKEACFGRVYDRAHLASHPRQKVTSLHILRSLAERKEAENWQPNSRDENIKRFRQEGMTDVSAYVSFRDRRETLYNSLICNKEGKDGVECYIECDGGSFNLKRQNASTILMKNNGFVLKGGCGEEPEDGKDVRFEPGADDKVFLLENKPVAACLAEAQKAVPIGNTTPLRERFKEDEAFCFGSDYDSAHLASHPRQVVTSLRVGRLDPAHEREDDADPKWWWFNVKLDVALTRKSAGAATMAHYACTQQEGSWDCLRQIADEAHTSCNDRRIQIVRGPGDQIYLHNRNSGLPIDSECETTRDTGQFPTLPLTKTDDKVFRLSRMPVQACRP